MLSWLLSIFPAAQSLLAGDARLKPYLPARSRTSRNPEPQRYFNRSRSRDVSLCRGSSTEQCEIPRIQVFGVETRATGAAPFTRIRSWNRNRRDIKTRSRSRNASLEPEPDPFKTIQLRIPDSGHAVPSPAACSPLDHSAPSRLPNDLLANRCSLGLLAQSFRTGNTQGRSGDRSMDSKQWRTEHTRFRVCPVPWICDTHAIT